MQVSVKFDVVKHRVSKRLACPCGHRFKRATTFEQTVNPWNVNADGQQRTSQEIQVELKKQADVWCKIVEPCPKCLEKNAKPY